MFGVSADNLRLDPHVLWRRKEGTIRRLRAALQQRLQKAGVEIIKGEAELIVERLFGSRRRAKI